MKLTKGRGYETVEFCRAVDNFLEHRQRKGRLLAAFQSVVITELFQLAGEDLFELVYFGANYKLAVGLGLIVVIVILVVIIGNVEFAEWSDLCDDGVAKGFFFVESFFVHLGFLALLIVVPEDDRAVLRAHIIALTVECSRVVARPEGCKEFIESDDSGIVVNVAYLGVAGGAIAHFLVGGVIDMAAAEA